MSHKRAAPGQKCNPVSWTVYCVITHIKKCIHPQDADKHVAWQRFEGASWMECNSETCIVKKLCWFATYTVRVDNIDVFFGS